MSRFIEGYGLTLQDGHLLPHIFTTEGSAAVWRLNYPQARIVKVRLAVIEGEERPVLKLVPREA